MKEIPEEEEKPFKLSFNICPELQKPVVDRCGSPLSADPLIF
jgi:hypothetical protein